MKKIIALTLAAVLLLALAACDTAPKTETRYLPETQIYEDNAGTLRETRFTYTPDGATQSMVTTENGQEISRVEYVLNGDGLLWKQITTESGVTSTMEYLYTLDDSGNPVRVEQTLDGQPYITSERTYDANGNILTNKSTMDMSGTVTTTTYDTGGNILKMEHDYGTGQLFATEYTYNDGGDPLTSVTNDAGGQRKTVYEYDSQGREVKTTEYLSDGTVSQYSETAYDGLTETVYSYSGDGTALTYRVAVRDEHGNLLSQEYRDPDGSLMFRQSYTWLAVEAAAD